MNRKSIEILMFLVILLSYSSLVLGAPQLLSNNPMNPASVGQGAVAKNIAVYGTGFQCGVSVTFSDTTLTTPNELSGSDPFDNQCGTAGIIQSNVQFFSSSNVFFYLNVSSSTPAGPVTVTFTNPDGSTGSGILVINAPPVITSVTPYPATGSPALATVQQGGTTTIQINGSGFQNGANLSGNFSVNSFYINGAGTVATANITVSSAAVPALNGVTITNPDGGSTDYASAFLVQWVMGSKTPAMTVYEDPRLTNGVRIPFNAFWNGEWSTEGTILPSNQTYYYPAEMVVQPHPFLFQQIMGHQVNSSLDFQVWNSGSWGTQLQVPSYLNSKDFDMAYESKSGKGLIVYGTASGIGYRQLFQDASDCSPNPVPCWGTEQALANLAIGSYFHSAVLLANPDRTKNEILLAFLTTNGINSTLYVDQWDGNAFFSLANSSVLPVSAAIRLDRSTFDLAYMQQSKTGMLAWLDKNSGTAKYCLWSAVPACGTASAFAATTGTTTTTSQLFRMQLRSDPASDQIALGTVEMNAGYGLLKTEIWDGTTWPTGVYSSSNVNGVYTINSNLTTLFTSLDWNVFDLLWKEGSTGSQLFSIYTNGVSGGLHYQIRDESGIWNGDAAVPGISTISTGGLPILSSISFTSDPRYGDILGTLISQSSLVASIRWDGDSASWVEYTIHSSPNLSSNYTFLADSYFRNFPTLDTSTLQLFDPPNQTGFVTSSPLTTTQGHSIKISASGHLIKDFSVLSFPGFIQTQSDTTTVSHSLATGVDTLTATGTISNTAVPGTYPLTITNPDGSLVIGNFLIQIMRNSSNPPNITTLAPNNLGQGATNQIVTLTGYNFPANFTVSFSGTGGVTAGAPVALNSDLTKFSIQVSVASNAATGYRDIIVTDSGTSQVYTFANLFTVNYGPSIISITPGTITQGTIQNIVVTGNDFQTGGTVTISNGTQSLGWDSAGGTSSALYQNKMTGNRFKFPNASKPFVLLKSASVLISLADPVHINGQMAIYSDNGSGQPLNLIATSAVTPLNSALCVNNPCTMTFSLPSTIILDTSQKYWVFFNTEGLQTVLAYDANQATCNGDNPCLSVSVPQSFGNWPASGTGVSWSPVPGGNRYALTLSYQPILGTGQVGATADLPGDDLDHITGGNTFAISAVTFLKGVYLYVDSVDSTNKSANLAIYDSDPATGAPVNRMTYGRINNNLLSKQFNFFTMPTNFQLTTAISNTFWIVANANGQGTKFSYDSVSPGLDKGIQFAQSYGTNGTFPWPIVLPSTPLLDRRYSSFAVTAILPPLGIASGGVTEGPDSNQMTGSRFNITQTANLVGISFYVDSLDPTNQLGNAAIYTDNAGSPGTLLVSSINQTLKAHAFNSIPVSLTTLSPGNYWLMVNVNGRGTTLTYDEGTSIVSAKKANLFTNPWPTTGGTGWQTSTPYDKRRYAIGVISDIQVSSSNVISGNAVNGGIAVDPNAAPGSRSICILNPDGGMACTTIQIVSGTKTNTALDVYGSLSTSPYPAYRSWSGSAPWSAEASNTVSAAAPPNWTVLRAFPNANLPGARSSEKILGTLNTSAFTLQIWNGTTWGTAFSRVPIPSFSRAFDIAYESATGRGLVVYGPSGSVLPQFTRTDGTSWSTPQSVPASSSGDTLWVRLEPNPDPKSSEIILAYLSGNFDQINGPVTQAVLHLLVWNGTSFGSEQTFNLGLSGDNINLCVTCLPPIIGQPFDIAYEHQSGRAIASWGIAGDSTPRYAIWSGSTWSSTASANQSAASSATSLVYFKLAGDPNSDQIALGTASIDGRNYDVQLWNLNGLATWGVPLVVSDDLLFNVDPSTFIPDPSFNVGRNFDLAWEKDSGALVTVFGSATSVNACGFRDQFGNPVTPFPYGTRIKRWDPVSGWSTDELVPPVGRDLVPRWIQLIQEPSSNDLFLELAGQPITIYLPTANPDQNPDTTNVFACTISENPTTHLTDPGITHYHHYIWSNRSWVDKEVLSSSSSGSLKSAIGPFQSYTGYSEPFMPAFSPDHIPPSPVSDLRVIAVSGGSATLSWTPTGDDGDLGKPASYILGYSTTPVTSDTDFANIPTSQKVTLLPGQLIPVPVITSTYSVSYTLSGLPAGTLYFTIESTDRAGNVSSVSSINPPALIPASGGQAVFAPSAVKDLAVVPGSLSSYYDRIFKRDVWSVQLTWTAPWISSTYSMTGAAYDLRWSSSPISSVNFDLANPVLAGDGTGRNGLSAPHLSGVREFFNFNDLPAGTTYFALKVCGPQGMDSVTFRCTGNALNFSTIDSISASVNASTQCYPAMMNTSCVNNGGTTVSTTPAAIADLSITGKGANSMTLRWTAPSNVAKYDVRYSRLQIVENGTAISDPTKQVEFKNASQVLSLPAPLSGGMIQSFAVTNLLSNSVGITYYYAIKGINFSTDTISGVIRENTAGISNVPSDTTLSVFDFTPPGTIGDLTVVPNGTNKNSVVLEWTATGDDGSIGKAIQYDIRYSELLIVENGTLTSSGRQIEFQNAKQVANAPFPLAYGNHELFEVTGLDPNTVYYFAIKAVDKASNSSSISICPNCPGHTALHSGYNLVSVPYRLSGVNDPTSVFGNDVSKPVTLYLWTSDMYSVPSRVTEGEGYFLYAAGNNSILRGTDSGGNLLGVPETAADVTIPLASGWNLIGNPYFYPIYLKDTCVRHGSGASVSFGTAVANGWVGSAIYSFDGTQYIAKRYQDILPPSDPNYQPPAILSLWNGYWLQFLAGDTGYNLIYLNGTGSCP